MDYLDPKKQFRERLVLIVGYILVAIAITMGTLLLVESAYGFGLANNGTVIQNGLVFFSSQPNPANIYINGKLTTYTTNTRLFLPSGVYNIKLTRTGYRPWERTVTFDAGSVEHFDYPVLFPSTLTTSSKVHTYNSAPGLATQSPSRQWLLVEQPGSMTSFDLYNLKNPAKPTITTITLPSNLLTKATISESWQFDEWADDNQHVLLTHLYDGKSEYILVDCANPSQSVNLNNVLGSTPSQLTLNNKKYNQYYIYNAVNQSLETATLSTGNVLTPYLQNVLAFQSYGSNTMLYVTSDGAPTGKVLLKLLSGAQTITIRNLPVSPSYLLNLTGFSGELYVAAGATSDGQIYIYPDPIGQYTNQQGTIVPSQVLNVPGADYLSFSDNAQFIVTEHDTSFSVYDIENQKTYYYVKNLPLDAPQINATWMDGDRLVYTSGNKLLVFDYDGTNQQTLMTENPNYLPFFSTDYRYVFSLSPADSNGKIDLDSTPLLTPADI